MTSKLVSIEIVDGFVEGINNQQRVERLRRFLIKGGSIFPSSIPILNNINFSCKTGERIAFIGSNGSGKSSLLKVIAGIYPLKFGTVKVHGDFAAIIETGIGFELEQTGRENIKMLMLYNNMLSRYSKELEQEIIIFSELGSKIDLPVKNYSSGMLSRLAFSVSVFQDADILLLDEIFATGDSYFVEKSTNFMKNKLQNIPILILVSHQENIIRDNCNRCILLKEGSIIADGNPSEILEIYNSGNY
ncbi:MAG TPA: ATP-binding cassette domain-containing protein [Rickettsia endosymbiont of Sericostoma sp.]|uniref:ABC transporter ATP-binding protein n=1 Tax=Candidatus Tisiphia endosymbiont of Ptychoptera albimana TaxID=3066260 RepID=UPI001D82DB72|nr:ATP-binding cassette domain-containing protein [Rickettsia endosymbiont of Sericostoma sp.]